MPVSELSTIANNARAGRSDRWMSLAQLAVRGLRTAYEQDDPSCLPHTVYWNGLIAKPAGFNVRYALICLAGLGKARPLEFGAEDLMDTLWRRVHRNRHEVENSAGDLGLGLWAQSLSPSSGVFSALQTLLVFQAKGATLDSVHLAWLLMGAEGVLVHESNPAAEELARLSKRALLGLFNPATSLFHRHPQHGPLRSVTRRVPCFANQIYPVMALAVHGRRTGCAESLWAGRSVADNLCRLQGRLGQWWWLYDAERGAVVDGYPVFSVHQDGMAPMALQETTRAGGRSYLEEIEKGLSWIYGKNELETDLVHPDPGLILRDIHKRRVGRVGRALRSAAWCWGMSDRKPAAWESEDFIVNHECRPYHLGWVLYAASVLLEDTQAAKALNMGAGV